MGRDKTVEALSSAGFEVTKSADGNLVAKRGSMAKTLLLGAMAGKNFQVTFPVAFYSDPQGNLVARISRELGTGALKGGAIGVNMTNNAFLKTSEHMVQTFSGAGILVTSIAHE